MDPRGEDADSANDDVDPAWLALTQRIHGHLRDRVTRELAELGNATGGIHVEAHMDDDSAWVVGWTDRIRLVVVASATTAAMLEAHKKGVADAAPYENVVYIGEDMARALLPVLQRSFARSADSDDRAESEGDGV